MKKITFVGRSLESIQNFPARAKREAGYQMDKIQQGVEPDDWKPMKNIGPGVNEVRIKDENGIYRVIYVAKFVECVYVLHAFQKKTQQTSKQDLDAAKSAYKLVLKERKNHETKHAKI